MDDARALVVGAGSIGLRHQRVLESLGLRTDLVSRRPVVGEVEGVRTHEDLAEALRDVRPEHVVIATETSAHRDTLDRLTAEGFRGSVLIEKPLAATAIGRAPANWDTLPFRTVAVGYQLRFHPAVAAARALMADAAPVTLEASVGQHLASWRPGRGVGDTASARLEDGGGVLRDLSHELDLILWLAGDWRRVCALGGRSGALGTAVATDDHWGILLELASGAVATVHLDALDRIGQRRLSLVAADRTVAVDLVGGGVSHADAEGSRIEQHPAGRDDVLTAMHRSLFEGASDDRRCSLEQGIAVVRLIDAIERSVLTGTWVDAESVT